MVGYYVAIIIEWFVTEGALATLGSNLPVEEFPHFSVGSKFSVSSWMMRIFNAPNAHLARPFLSRDCFSAAAEERMVNRAQLITAESHGVLLIDLGAIVRLSDLLVDDKRPWRGSRREQRGI
jgi:hypothetical protein